MARLKAPMYILKRRAHGTSKRAQTRLKKLRSDGIHAHKIDAVELDSRYLQLSNQASKRKA